MSTYLAREREKEGETGENAGEERGTLLTKFQGVSRHFNVFSLPEDCARRDAHTPCIARSRTFIAAESEFLLYAGSHSAALPPQPIFRGVYGPLG